MDYTNVASVSEGNEIKQIFKNISNYGQDNMSPSVQIYISQILE